MASAPRLPPTFTPHIRVSALGRLGLVGNQEQFSYGFSIAVQNGVLDTPGFQGVPQQGWTDMADSVRDFHARATTFISPLAVLEHVKFALIGPSGSYLVKPPIVRDYNSPGGASEDGHTLPQSALAITLDTSEISQSGRGRFFIPMPYVSIGVPVAGSMLILPATADSIRDSAATMLNDINNFPGLDVFSGGARVCVASSKGNNWAVTGVRVGRVVDTMRSRRNKLKEQYTASAAVS